MMQITPYINISSSIEADYYADPEAPIIKAGYEFGSRRWREGCAFEYLENTLILNLIDAHDEQYINKVAIDEAMRFGIGAIKNRQQLTIHCALQRSRSPSIAMLLWMHTSRLDFESFTEAAIEFTKVYPNYFPGKGMKNFLIKNWQYYRDFF
jgi:hypothetical protein